MPLESLGDPDKINVKHLAVDEPERHAELPFDPDRDVDEAMVNKINDGLQVLKQQGQWREYGHVLNELVTLWPEKRSLARPEIREAMEKRALVHMHQEDWRSFFVVEARLKNIFPDHTAHLEESWDKIAAYIRACPIFTFLVVLAELRVVSPSYAKKIPVGEKEYNEGVQLLQKYKEEFQWHDYLVLAKAMKLIFPDFSDPASADDWKAMKEAVKPYIRARPSAETLANMKILAAEEAYIDQDGQVVIHMRKERSPDFKEGSHPIPQTRDF